jgi:hypothetical protein
MTTRILKVKTSNELPRSKDLGLSLRVRSKCIGCELCVLEAQRQLKKIGLEGSLIRIFRNKKDGSEYPEYSVELDPHINALDIEKIRAICPVDCFEIIAQDGND